jgi:hypothetical protein
MESVNTAKYITFKREDFYQMMGALALPPWTAPDGTQVGSDWDCAPLATNIQEQAAAAELVDAVVIRRQDLFAGPALHAYSNNMAMAARMVAEGDEQKRLLGIADYFHDQAVLADEEAWKLPD